MYKFYFTIVLLCNLSFNTVLQGEIFLKTAKHSYEVSSKGFTEKVFAEGFATEDGNFHIVYTPLENIDDIFFESQPEGGSWSKTKRKAIKADNVLTSNFYTGTEKYSFEVLKGMHFRISYTIESAEIKLVSSMRITGMYKTDSAHYSYVVPKELSFEWKSAIADSSLKITIDSTANGNSTTYRFTVFNKEHKGRCRDVIYLSIHPKEISAADDLNKWQYALSQKTNGLSDDYYNQLKPDLFTDDTLANIYTLFNRVRERISYIDYEEGYAAWQPSAADYTIQNKKGDCKDMANVMHQCLTRMGVESYLATIASTHKNISFVFPTLSAFDHMICIARFKNKWIVLDATDDESPVGYPSTHTQGRTAFCINNASPFEIKIPVVSPDSNLIRHSFDLTVSDNTLKGTWTMTLRGMAAGEFNHLIFNGGMTNAKDQLLKNLKRQVPKYTVMDVQMPVVNKDSITVQCTVSYSGQLYIETNNKKYISLSLLPNPIDINTENDDCRKVDRYAVKESVNTIIHFPGKISLKSEFKNEMQEAPVSYHILAKSDNSNNLHFNYNYTNTAVEMLAVEMQPLIRIKKSFEKYMKSLIEIEN